MKISRLEIRDFGKFTDNETIDNMNKEMTLFYGKNEAGKTTMFNLIKTALYGFLPANAQSHPYSSWDNGRIEFTTYFETSKGLEAIVHRKLLSRPQGKYIAGDTILDLKNAPLPISNHVSSEIYEKIYSLRVEDLTEIQGKAWDEVEDKLLAGYGTAAIRSTRDAIQNIKGEYEKIWRESGRGKYLIKELDIKIKELKKLRKEAYTKEDEIRNADTRIDEINFEIKKLKERKIYFKTLLSKGKELIPIKKKLDRLKLFNVNLINKELALSLPHDIRERESIISDELQDIRDEKNRKRQILSERTNGKYPISSADDILLQNKTKIITYSKKYPGIESLREEINKFKNNAQKLSHKLSHEADNFFAEKWNSNIKNSLKMINKSELKILVSNYKNTAKNLYETRLKKDMKSGNEVDLNLSKGYLISLLLALIFILGGFLLKSDLLRLVGFGALVYGITGIIGFINMKKALKRNSKKSGLNELEAKIKELEKKLQTDEDNLMNYLSGVPISKLMIKNMDDMFIAALINIKDMAYELEELEVDLELCINQYNEKKGELDDFLKLFSFESFVREDEKIFLLRDRLGELEKEIITNENLEREISELYMNLKILEDKEKNVEKILDDYITKLSNIGDGNIDKGISIVENNFRIKAKIDSIMDELKEMPDIDILNKEIQMFEQDNNLVISDHEMLKVEDELEDINQRINSFEVEKARLEESINKLSQNMSLGEIESRLSLLEDEFGTMSRKRDRLAILSEVIKFADQKFKEENQPDVLKNAGKYFGIMTGGKYTDIYIDEDDEGNSIMVKQAGETIPKKVTNTFSKGTLNQLYLALRLSLIDYLDKDKEALPICFDELLVNWDELRLNSTLKLLTELCKRRQIFIFTCHDWIAGKIEEFFNVKRIEL